MAGKESWEICYYAFPSGKGGAIEKGLNKLGLHEVYCCYDSDVTNSGKYPIFHDRVPDGAMRDIAKLHEITIQDQLEKNADELNDEVERSLRVCEKCPSYKTKPGY